MPWIVLALGAALSWGLYGPSLHSGQMKLGSPFRALLCVGIAYFLIGVLTRSVAAWPMVWGMVVGTLLLLSLWWLQAVAFTWYPVIGMIVTCSVAMTLSFLAGQRRHAA